MRVMLVDEARERAEVLRTGLAQAGHEVVAHIFSTIDLPAAVAQHRPDIIIVDTDSPSRDTLEHLCVVSRDQPRPVVMFSHDKDSAIIREAVRAGVTAYIVDGLEAARITPIIEVAVARFDEFQQLQQKLTMAEDKLSSRIQIDRAKGILMAQKKYSEEEAYQVLRKMAMDRNLRMAEVAQQIIDVTQLLA